MYEAVSIFFFYRIRIAVPNNGIMTYATKLHYIWST